MRYWISDVCSADLLDIQLEHARKDFRAVAQQLVDTERRRRRVEALLLDGRAEVVAVLAPGHEVAAVEAQDPIDEPSPGLIAEQQSLTPIGLASCRERVWQYGEVAEGAGSLN